MADHRHKLAPIAAAAMMIAAALAVAAPIGAQSPDPCRNTPAGTGVAAAIIDGRSFRAPDGQVIRLAGIEIPPPPIAGLAGPLATTAAAVKPALAAVLRGQSLNFHAAVSETDRYGRRLLFVSAADDESPTIQQDLVSRGLALVSARVGDAACAAALLAAERTAREAKLGLWADPYYLVTGARNFDALKARRGRFAIVEGQIASVRASGGTIYLNFGRQWSRVLTVTVAKRNEPVMAATLGSLGDLKGREVRVRGWIEDRNGPRIEAAWPEQIELVDKVSQ